MYRHVIKRFIDVILSFIGLIVLAIPMAIIAIAINFDSKGGAIFTQERMGKKKRPFTVYKFRTMIPSAYAIGGTNTYQGDPRITKVGAFLRKTSLDELPQLINILKGEMSIIGPRPILKEEEKEVDHPERSQDRYKISPGLFCTVDLDLRAMASRTLQFKMDCDYYKHMSFPLDCKVFFGIIRTVISGDNVYKLPQGVESYDDSEGESSKGTDSKDKAGK